MKEDTYGKTTKHRFRLESKVYDIKRIIEAGSSNQVLRSGLAPYGYGHQNLNQAANLADRCYNAIRKRKYALNEQKGLTEEYKQARARVHDTYMDLVKIARVAFKNDYRARIDLQLNGRRKIAWLAWREQVRCLYTKLLSAECYQAAMNRFNYPESRLRNELASAEKAFAKYEERENARIRAQHATQDRNQLLNQLFNWFSDYMVFIRIVLKEEPELMTGLLKGHDGKIFVPNDEFGEPGTFREPHSQ